MYRFFPYLLTILIVTSCNSNEISTPKNKMTASSTDSLNFKSGYSTVNGLKMYHEIYGQGKPLVLIHGGGSTIETSFGRIIPHLTGKRQLICIELQAHGRSSDRNKSISFEQDADDVAAL